MSKIKPKTKPVTELLKKLEDDEEVKMVFRKVVRKELDDIIAYLYDIPEDDCHG